MRWFETANPDDFDREREAARANKARYYWRLERCARDHFAPRYVASDQCLMCKWVDYQEWLGPCTEETLERERERKRAYRRTAGGYQANKRQYLKHMRLRTARTPPWLLGERREIEAFYQEAWATGLEVHHIVPLTPKAGNIVGVHCLVNLRRVTDEEHGKLGNAPPAGDPAEFVRRGMAIWKSDIGTGGRINWRPYVGDRLKAFLVMLRIVTRGGRGKRPCEIIEYRGMPFVNEAESWQALSRWLNRVRDMPSGGLVLRKRRGLWVARRTCDNRIMPCAASSMLDTNGL